jgi:hypothetical protein
VDFSVHYTWEAPLRNLVTILLQQIVVNALGRSRARRNARNTRRHYRQRVHKLFAEGRLGAATKTIEIASTIFADPSADVSAPPTDEQVVEIINSLNPPSSDDDALPAPIEGEAIDGVVFDNMDVRTALKLLPSGSANGASGWTCDIIRRLYSDAEAVDYSAIAALFNAFAAGRLPSQYWVTSRAVLIPKPNNNGFRPLGIGEAWYRYLGRALLYKVGEETGQKLLLHQLGCSIYPRWLRNCSPHGPSLF